MAITVATAPPTFTVQKHTVPYLLPTVAEDVTTSHAYLDVVTFTSPSAVKNLVAMLGAEPAADLLRTTIVASIGPVTAEAAAQYGIATALKVAGTQWIISGTNLA